MSEFFSRNNRPRFASFSFGDCIVCDFSLSTDDKGREIVVEVGRKNQNDIIQSHREATLIENIIARYVRGDDTALNNVRGFYADLTSLPSSLVEAHRHMNSIENQFNTLPKDIKAKFGNDVNVFLKEVSSMDIDTYLDVFDLKRQPVTPQNFEDLDKKDGGNNG